jgi:hypothetical protein
MNHQEHEGRYAMKRNCCLAKQSYKDKLKGSCYIFLRALGELCGEKIIGVNVMDVDCWPRFWVGYKFISNYFGSRIFLNINDETHPYTCESKLKFDCGVVCGY